MKILSGLIGVLVLLFVVGCSQNEPFVVEVESTFLSPTELEVQLVTNRNTMILL